MKIWLPYIQTGSGSDTFTKSLAEALSNRGHETVPQPFNHKYQYCPWLLKSERAPENTDIILTNSWSGFAFNREASKLVVVEHHFVLDPEFRPYKSIAQSIFHNTLVRYYENQAVNMADAVVAVSKATAKAMSKGLNIPMPQVILNGIDVNYYHPDSKIETTPPPMSLLFVGNMSRRKGADLLPGIMAELGQDYELYYTSGLRSSEDPFNDIPNMRSLGRLSQDELRDEYRKANLLLFPTRLEGFGLAAAEAMACGTPVVASNNSALPEVIKDNVDGRLCLTDNIMEFCSAIRELNENPDMLKSMSSAALENAKRRFSIERMVSEYETLFSKLLNND